MTTHALGFARQTIFGWMGLFEGAVDNERSHTNIDVYLDMFVYMCVIVCIMRMVHLKI